MPWARFRSAGHVAGRGSHRDAGSRGGRRPRLWTFLNRAGLRNDGTFKACVQAMMNAVPRTRIKGEFVRPEAETLERLRLAFFEEMEAPAEEEPEERPEQMRLM